MATAAMRASLIGHGFEKAGIESAGQSLPFILSGPQETIVGQGARNLLPPIPTKDLSQSIAAFWRAEPQAPMIAGILPFDYAKPAHLFAPERIERALPKPSRIEHSVSKPNSWTSLKEPAPEAYAQAVKRALALLDSKSDLRKVVLARSLLMTAPNPIDLNAVLAQLRRDPSVTTYAVPLPPDANGTPHTLVGATPELLVDKRGAQVQSLPLAGSARRHPENGVDEAAAKALMRSQKDLLEHGFVVEAILDTLAPYCAALSAPNKPSLISTASMWHLGTAISGQLKDAAVSVVELASALHPTPAVCGLPRAAARESIAELEGFDRGFYAGAVGWADRAGDGRWMVAIRCADFAGNTARLYAGAGIVTGSDPWSEVAETSAKFTALLAALGTDETGKSIHE